MNNWNKHGESASSPSTWKIDPYSSAVMFPRWREREDKPFLWRGPKGYEPLAVYQPRTWLLRTCWMRHGAISYREVPSSAWR